MRLRDLKVFLDKLPDDWEVGYQWKLRNGKFLLKGWANES